MSISNGVDEPELSPHEFAEIQAQKEKSYRPRARKLYDDAAFTPGFGEERWHFTGFIIATIFLSSVLLISVTASHTLNRFAPNNPAPKTGVVVKELAPVPDAVPAYPTVKQVPDPNAPIDPVIPVSPGNH